MENPLALRRVRVFQNRQRGCVRKILRVAGAGSHPEGVASGVMLRAAARPVIAARKLWTPNFGSITHGSILDAQSSDGRDPGHACCVAHGPGRTLEPLIT